jgi:hypothetical protein
MERNNFELMTKEFNFDPRIVRHKPPVRYNSLGFILCLGLF